MNIEDIFLLPPKINVEPWQIGAGISLEIPENGVALIFCSEERGGGRTAEGKNFQSVRKEFYQLSKLDFEIQVSDLGDLISGGNVEDTRYILQEVLLACLQKGSIPVLVGGSNDLAMTLFKTLNECQEKVNYTQVNSFIHLQNDGGDLTDKNFLTRIFGDKNLKLGNYYHLGYQKHLNEVDAVKLMKEVDFEVLRLAEMMNSTEQAEPFLRRADLVTLNCDVVESFAEAFSVKSQVNGLNRREICGLMKEIGLGENLKAVGVFDYNTEAKNSLNAQLLAQMLWYLVEGIHIQRTHPKERQFETFIVMVEDFEYFFKRDTFSGLWYLGKDKNIKNCLPCSAQDYENAKRGIIAKRLK